MSAIGNAFDGQVVQMINNLLTHNNELQQQNQQHLLEKMTLQQQIFNLQQLVQQKQNEIDAVLQNLNKQQKDVKEEGVQTAGACNNSFFTESVDGFSSHLYSTLIDAVIRNKCLEDGTKDGATDDEKKHSKRARAEAATEVLWELGYQNHQITDELSRKVKRRISARMSARKYDQKPERKQRNKKKPVADQLIPDQTIADISSVPLNSSVLLNSTLNSSVPLNSSVQLQSTSNSIQINNNNTFDAYNPNDPLKISVGMVVAVAFEDDGVFYAAIDKAPHGTKNGYSAYMRYYDVDDAGKLIMLADAKSKAERLRDVIYTDVTIDNGDVVENEEINARYKLYSDKWFA